MNNELPNYEKMKRYQISVTILFFLCVLLPGFAQQTKILTLLQTSDTHSRIEPIDIHAADKYAGMGGFVRRATMLTSFVKTIRMYWCSTVETFRRVPLITIFLKVK